VWKEERTKKKEERISSDAYFKGNLTLSTPIFGKGLEITSEWAHFFVF
jgi:hypothetical protein